MNKKTKIIATISDLRCDVEFIKRLYKEGMNVVRLNTAHQTPKESLKIIENVRKLSDKIAIMIDTKGPEIRTTKTDEIISVSKNQEIIIKGSKFEKSTRDCLYLNYEGIVKDVPLDSFLLIDDGDIELKVVKKSKDKLVCKVMNNGIIRSNKSVNIPGVHISLPSLSKKDKQYIDFAIKYDVDFIAHSFVRNKEDVLGIQKILNKKKSHVKIIAKIENQEGVDNIDEILDHCYGIMIARGDLGIEIYTEKIPTIQKNLINKCIFAKKPVIVATQMLHSMTKNPRPTRAEVSDIANAVYDGADAIMLSGETAHGDHPIDAVRMMTKVSLDVEENKGPINLISETNMKDEISAFLVKSAIKSTINLPVKAIITDTTTGKTARYLSAYRGNKIVYAKCYTMKVTRELTLSYGIYPEFMKKELNASAFLNKAIIDLLKKKCFKKSDLIAIVAGNFGPNHGASFLEISTAKNIMKIN